MLLVLISCDKDEVQKSTLPENENQCLTVRGPNHGKVIEDQYILAFNNTNLSTARSIDAATSVLNRHKVKHDYVKQISNGFYTNIVVTLTNEQAMLLAKDQDVKFIEHDRIVSICSCFKVVEPRTVTWSVGKIGFGDGVGKTAWVVDTGIDLDHPDLNVDRVRSRSFINGQASADDGNGHGTHVAGIIGAVNNRTGLLGVASGASLVALKVLDNQGEGLLSTVIAALNYIKANAREGDVVNLSLGVDQVSQILNREIQTIASRGIYFSIAAGNEGKPSRDYSPASVNGRNIYTISAVDSLNRFANFSNYGNDVVDYAAPGVRVVSTFINGRYAVMSGTSMAAPHVAGILLVNGGRVNSFGFASRDPDGTSDRIALK